jgi:hypothetical protein
MVTLTHVCLLTKKTSGVTVSFAGIEANVIIGQRLHPIILIGKTTS